MSHETARLPIKLNWKEYPRPKRNVVGSNPTMGANALVNIRNNHRHIITT